MKFEEEPKRYFEFGFVALFLQKKRSWSMEQRLKKTYLLCFKANPELVLALYIYKEEERKYRRRDLRNGERNLRKNKIRNNPKKKMKKKMGIK